MYFDEDGDLAHEFYEEVKINDSQTTAMKRKLVNLQPQASQIFFMADKQIYLTTISFIQGTVYYPNPRLHVDFPIPMYSPIEK